MSVKTPDALKNSKVLIQILKLINYFSDIQILIKFVSKRFIWNIFCVYTDGDKTRFALLDVMFGQPK